MMPIFENLKESQECLDSFSAPSTFDPIVRTFFSPKKLFPARSLAPHFQKGGMGGSSRANPFFAFSQCILVCIHYTMHNFAFLEAIRPSIKSISHVFCLFLLVIICNTDQMICFHATLKSIFCQKQIFDNRCVPKQRKKEFHCKCLSQNI